MAKKKTKQDVLPGMELPAVNEAITDAALEYVDVRDQRMALTKREVEKRDELIDLMREAKLTTYKDPDSGVYVTLDTPAPKIHVTLKVDGTTIEESEKPVGEDTMRPVEAADDEPQTTGPNPAEVVRLIP